MGRGGGGGDLNMKKSWHTQTYRVMEKVWKAEQAAQEEQKKAEQLRKELAEERQMEEMRRMQEAAGHVKKRAERVDWMYSGHSASSSQLQEEYLLGKRRLDQRTTEEEAVEGSLQAQNQAQNDRDMLAKIREDPMLAIKKREQDAVKEIVSNPLKMQKLRELKERMEQEREQKRRREDSPSAAGPASLPFAPSPNGAGGAAVRPSYRPGGYGGRPPAGRGAPARPQLTPEERAARLAAMQADAAWNDQQRMDRVRQMEIQDALERAKLAAAAAKSQADPKFLESIKRKTYMGNDAASLADRVQRNRGMLADPVDKFEA